MNRLPAVRIALRPYAVPVLFVSALALTAAIGARGLQLHMHDTVHARLCWYDFPSAVSMLYHGGAPYVAYTEIQDRMMQSHPVVDGKLVQKFDNDLLRQATVTPVRDRSQTRLFPGDDKGLLDIVVLAFLLFGPTMEGVFYTCLLILLASILAFFADWRDRPDRCIAPVLILGGLFVAMPALTLTGELHSFTNPRLFELLALIPFAHIAFAIIDRAAFRWSRLIALSVQVLIVIECVHVRCTATWVVLAATLLLLARLAIAYRVGGNGWWRAGSPLRAELNGTWIVALLLAGMGGLKLYQYAVYDPAYRTTYLEHRVVWHNMGIGFALNPALAERLHLQVNDCSWAGHVGSRALAKHGQARYEQIWGKPGTPFHVGEMVKDFQAYEEESRAAVLEVFWRHPVRAVLCYVYYKPALALRTFAWAFGLCANDVEALHLYNQSVSLPEPEVIERENRHVRLGELLGLGVALALGCLGLGIGTPALRAVCGLFALATAGSLIPAAMTYPVLHVMGVAVIAAAVLVLAFLVTVLVAAGQRLARGSDVSVAAEVARC